MKKITTSSSVFGPYKSVEIMSDRYRVDGADLPFIVVGIGVIADVDPSDFPAQPLPRPQVPSEVTMRQARLALLGAGLLPSIYAAIAALPEPDKSAALIEWEYAGVVGRGSGLIPAMGAALGMTDAQIDTLFTQAATL